MEEHGSIRGRSRKESGDVMFCDFLEQNWRGRTLQEQAGGTYSKRKDDERSKPKGESEWR